MRKGFGLTSVMGMRVRVQKKLVFTLALIIAVGAVSAAADSAATADIFVPGTFGAPPLSFKVATRPKKLSQRTMEPISLEMGGEVTRGIDGSQPPDLQELTVDLDKNESIDVSSVAHCGRRHLTSSYATALSACRAAIIGKGSATIEVEAQGLSSLTIPLTVFNGGKKEGTTKLYIYGVVATPLPTPLIATMTIKSIRQGPFGLQAVLALPPIAGGSGSLLSFDFLIKRRVEYRGSPRSVVRARCREGKLLANLISYGFADGQQFTGERLIRTCVPLTD